MVILTTIVCYWYIHPLLYFLSEYLLMHMKSNKFFFSDLTNIFYLYIELSIYIALIITFPFIILNFFQYFMSGWYLDEYQKNVKIFFFFLFWYLFGFFLSYKIFLPALLQFCLEFEQQNVYIPLYFEAKFEEYFFNIILTLLIWNLSFQIPWIFYAINSWNLFPIRFSKKFRKYIYIFFIFWISILSPFEISQQFIMYLFWGFFFELYVFWHSFKIKILK